MGMPREMREQWSQTQRNPSQPMGLMPPEGKGKRKPCLGCGDEPGNLATGLCWNCRRERAKEG